MKTVADLLKNRKNNNIYFIDPDNNKPTILEKCDTVYDLFFEIEIEIYNDYIDENFTQEWKNCIIEHGLFLLKKDNTKVYLHEFIELVGHNKEKEEWFMCGDEKYHNYY